jgi:hypothetical protein
MNRTSMIFVAAAVAIGFTAPANAEFVKVGSVGVGFHTDRDAVYRDFRGRMESLSFTATRSDIYCRSIIVRYGNGDTQNVFSGRLNEHRPVVVDLRGRAPRVDSVRFVCRSQEWDGGRIFISAEVGRYRGEWGRDFGHGGGMGPGGMGPGGMGPGGGMMGPGNEWISLGRESFEGRNDRESAFTGWAGHRVERIALRPLDGDARCMSIVATFENGQKVKLADNRVLERGRMTVYDLPGYQRNIRKLYMRCRAVGDYRVVIEVLVRK